jgi:hypothetical protein
MKTFLFAFLLLIAACAARAEKPAPVVVLELFTSEGCSSCPPADKLLGDLIARREKDGNFFALAFHVDYWNYIGWQDRFSDSAYTARQQKYTDAFGLDAMYTPQMIVNGKEQTVGDDNVKIEGFIEKALGKPPAFSIDTLTASVVSGDTIVVRYSNRQPIHPLMLMNIALVEKGLSSNVAKGENAGKKLYHENVVRAFATQKISGDKTGGGERFAVPEGVTLKNCEIIAYLQDVASLAVLGAAETKIQ